MTVIETANQTQGDGIDNRLEEKCERNDTPAPPKLGVDRLEHNADGKPGPGIKKEDNERSGQNVPAVKDMKFELFFC